MSDTFWIKRGDTLPQMRAQLLDPNAAAVNLTDATVKLVLRPVAGGAAWERAMVVEAPATNGWIHYDFVALTDWDGAGLLQAGHYHCEHEVTFASGDVQTYPTRDYNRVVVYDDLA